jgi:sigma-B regulation protein RsbQ
MGYILQRNNVRVVGNGRRQLVFAHGFGCDQNVWRHLVEAFHEEYTCILFDYVGAGGSDLNAYDAEKYNSLDGYARDLLEVCEALSLENPILIGHSVSCMIGVRADVLKPGYFSQMIFVTPSPSYINDGNYPGGMEKADLDDLLTMMDSNYLGWSSTIAPLVMGNTDRPELGEELTANFCSTDPNIARDFARVTFLSDSRNDLPQLSVPSLTLQCSDDMLVPMPVGDFIQTTVKNNTRVILEATGHCPHLSAPAETISAIRNYLR